MYLLPSGLSLCLSLRAISHFSSLPSLATSFDSYLIGLIHARHSIRMAHRPLESLQTPPLRSNSSLPLGPRRNPPSRHNNLVRHNDSPFLPRRHRMRIRSWSPPLPLLLLPP